MASDLFSLLRTVWGRIILYSIDMYIYTLTAHWGRRCCQLRPKPEVTSRQSGKTRSQDPDGDPTNCECNTNTRFTVGRMAMGASLFSVYQRVPLSVENLEPWQRSARYLSVIVSQKLHCCYPANSNKGQSNLKGIVSYVM